MSEPRVNVYVCQKCGGHTVTVDVDEGVTPFMIGCHAKESEAHPAEAGSRAFAEALERDLNVRVKEKLKLACDGMAYSSFYPRGPRPAHIGEPKWEWYKPGEPQFSYLSRSSLEHVAKGGLLLRKRTDRRPVMHGLPDAELQQGGAK